MGRHRREIPTGKLRLKYKKSEFDKNKGYTLYFEYTWLSSAPIRKDTGLRVKVSDWNEKTQELRSSFGREYKRENIRLADTIQQYDSKLREYNDKHPNKICSEIIRSILFDKPLTRKDEGIDFCEYTVRCLNSKLLKGKIGKSRYENGISAMRVFREFLVSQNMGTYAPDSIYLGEISVEIVERYIEYRRNVKKNFDATINHALAPIISACESARDEGYIDTVLYSQIKGCRIVERPDLEESKDVKFLNKDELKRLIEFYKTDTEQRRKEYVEMFLFAFHAGGLRLVDIMTLKWEHIDFEKKELKKILIKTARGQNPRHTIPLTEAAIGILNKWKEMGRRKKFVFDLIPDEMDLNNEDDIYYARNNVDKKINQALKVVGIRIGLSFPLGFHAARHTFAVNALNDGMSLSVVSRLLGHATTDTTEQRYAEYLPKRLAEELKKMNYDDELNPL